MPLLVSDKKIDGKYRLGIDSNSTVVALARVATTPKVDHTNIILDEMVYREGVARDQQGHEVSPNQERRLKRSARRQRDRRQSRRNRVKSILNKHGFPGKSGINPYAARAKGNTNPLSREEFHAAFLHLSRKRGFPNLRKEEGVFHESAARIEREMNSILGCKTIGEYFYRQIQKGKTIRNSRIRRSLVLDEFDILWETQSKFYPEELTEDFRNELHEAIFFEIGIRKSCPEQVGYCTYEIDEKRCRLSSWYHQECSLLQWINNLAIIDTDKGFERKLTIDEKQNVRQLFGSKKEVSLNAIKKTLGLTETQSLNMENSKKDKQRGNVAAYYMGLISGHDFSSPNIDLENPELLREYEEIIEDMLFAQDEYQWAEDNDLSPEDIQKAVAYLPKGYSSLSKKAIRNILPYLRNGHMYYHACVMAGYEKESLSQKIDSRDRLPHPNEILPIYADQDDDLLNDDQLKIKRESEERIAMMQLDEPEVFRVLRSIHTCNNDVVKKSLLKLRKAINQIIEIQGHPPELIRIELAREIKGGRAQREKTLDKINQAQKRNEQLREEFWKLTGKKRHIRNGSELLRFRLWKDQKGIDVYDGSQIPFANAFGPSSEYEIDHIIPYSRSLDDSYMNLVLTSRKTNFDKGNRMPYEYFTEEQMTRIKERSKGFPRPKRTNIARHQIDEEEFINRNLKDVQYISRLARDYLQILGVPVEVTFGQMTSKLTASWGSYESINADGSNRKNRDDIRHHAIDAAIVASTTNSHILELCKAAKKKGEDHVSFDLPWETFKNDLKQAVDDVNIRCESRIKISGSLHEETFRGRSTVEKELGEGIYGTRKAISSLTAPEIIGNVDKDGNLTKGIANEKILKAIVAKIESFLELQMQKADRLIQDLDRLLPCCKRLDEDQVKVFFKKSKEALSHRFDASLRGKLNALVKKDEPMEQSVQSQVAEVLRSHAVQSHRFDEKEWKKKDLEEALKDGTVACTFIVKGKPVTKTVTRVRVVSSHSKIARVKDKHVKTGNNHSMLFFESKKQKQPFETKVLTMIDAVRLKGVKEGKHSLHLPSIDDRKPLFSLVINDVVEIDEEFALQNAKNITPYNPLNKWRVQKIDQDGSVFLRPLWWRGRSSGLEGPFIRMRGHKIPILAHDRFPNTWNPDRSKKA